MTYFIGKVTASRIAAGGIFDGEIFYGHFLPAKGEGADIVGLFSFNIKYF